MNAMGIYLVLQAELCFRRFRIDSIISHDSFRFHRRELRKRILGEPQ